jgi:hypothetical protein
MALWGGNDLCLILASLLNPTQGNPIGFGK